MKSFAIAAICMVGTVYGWTGCFFDTEDKKQGAFFYKDNSADADKDNKAGAKFGKDFALVEGTTYSLDIYDSIADDTAPGTPTF